MLSSPGIRRMAEKAAKESDEAKPIPLARANLHTSPQLAAWRERLRGEQQVVFASIASAKTKLPHDPISFYSFYKQVSHKNTSVEPEFDPRSKRDCSHPHHLLRKHGYTTQIPLKSSQEYGRGVAIDDPKLWNYQRASISAKFEDRSHLHV